MVNYLDPEKKLVDHLLSREHCLPIHESIMLKDLQILKDRNAKDIIFVDNQVYCFGLQLENGVPIVSFENNPNDKELVSLSKYITNIARYNDLRICNRLAFNLSQIKNSNIENYLGFYLKDDEDEDDDDAEDSEGESTSTTVRQAKTKNGGNANFEPSGEGVFRANSYGSEGLDQELGIDTLKELRDTRSFSQDEPAKQWLGRSISSNAPFQSSQLKQGEKQELDILTSCLEQMSSQKKSFGTPMKYSSKLDKTLFTQASENGSDDFYQQRTHSTSETLQINSSKIK